MMGMSNNNVSIFGESFGEVYRKSLELLLYYYSYESAPRNQKVRECLNVQLNISNPYLNLFENTYRGIPLSYLKNELLLYFSGRSDSEGFTKASKFWDKIKTEDNKINSAYGNLIFNETDCYLTLTDKDGNKINDSVLNDSKNIAGLNLYTAEYISQWNWAKVSLLKDSDTRQAIMHFNRPYHQYSENKDFVCTMYGIFHIRDNQLYFSTFMRSQDIRKGTQFDIPFFTILQQIMLNELRKVEKYKDLQMGSYTHFCNSFHIYEPDFDIAKEMLNADWNYNIGTPIITKNPILDKDIIGLSYDKINYEIIDIDSNCYFYNWLRS